MASTKTERKNKSAAELSEYFRVIGRKGGLIGGKRSAEKLTIAQRSVRARKAAESRWKKQKPTA